MIKVRTKTTGNLFVELDKLEADIKGKISIAGVAAMAQVIYKEAHAYAALHNKTGLLQSAIYRRFAKEKSRGEQKVYQVSWSRRIARHGHFLEFGTSRAPAYPFLTPAFGHIKEAIAAGKQRMAERLAERNGQATE